MKLQFITTLLTLICCSSNTVKGAEFDAGFFNGEEGAAAIDLSSFTQQDGVIPPGEYLFSLFINESDMGKHLLQLKRHKEKLDVCVPLKLLEQARVKFDEPPPPGCLFIADYIPGAGSEIQPLKSSVYIHIPQLYIGSAQVSWSNADEGVPALFSSWQLSGNQSSLEKNLSLNAINGINLYGWRLRNFSSYSRGKDSHSSSGETFVEKNINSLKSLLTLGATSSQSSFMAAAPFTGIKLESDDMMFDDLQMNYVPVIRGVAKNNNARIEIKNEGRTLYTTQVAAGPFALTDYNGQYASGDFEVYIHEPGGEVRHFTVSHSSISMLRTPGTFRYSLAAGRLEEPGIYGRSLAQGTLEYGLPAGFSLYGGFALNKGNNYYVLGLAKDMGALGALAWDSTQMQAAGGNLKHKVSYEKQIQRTDTRLTFSYAWLQKKLREQPEQEACGNLGCNNAEFEFSLNQSFDWLGSLYLSYSRKADARSASNQYQLTWNKTFDWFDISASLGKSLTAWQQGGEKQNDKYLTLNISIPFQRSGDESRFIDRLSYLHSDGSDSLSLSGSAAGDRLNYSLEAERSGSVGGSLSWLGRAGEVTLGADYDARERQYALDYGYSGSAIWHPQGLTFSQYISDSAAIVKVGSMENVAVDNHTGVATNASGLAVIPSTSPYRENVVTLNPKSFIGSDISQPERSLIPARGAISFIDFEIDEGERALLSMSWQGRPLPFGAAVTFSDADGGTRTAIAGDNGEVYFPSINPQGGTISVSWRDQGVKKSCSASLPPFGDRRAGRSNILTGEVVCK